MNDKLRQLLEKQYKRYRRRMMFLERYFNWPWLPTEQKRGDG